MPNPIPPQSTTGSSIPKAAWIAAGTIGTLIVVLLAAVLYKLSAPAAPSGAPAPTVASMPAPPGQTPGASNNPQSAIAVTNANPAAPSSAQFPSLRPSTTQGRQEQRPASRHTATVNGQESGGERVERPVARTGSTNGAYAPQTFPAQQAPVQPPQVCSTCGTVVSVTPVQEPGQANGVGAVVGGLVGGLLGNQVGGGNGRTAATVIGAVGGGLAGNEVQKRVNAKTVYQVQVRMDDGQVRTATVGVAPPVGQRVQFGANGGLNPLP